MKLRNIPILFILLGLLAAPTLVNAAADTNAAASTNAAEMPMATTNTPAVSTSKPAPVVEEANPALKALAAKAVADAAKSGIPLNAPKNGELVSVISARNIFDPTRRPGVIRTNIVRTVLPRSDWFSLQGTSRNDGTWSAFFDGTAPDYRKAAQRGDTIAGYKIADIAADYIMLQAASNSTIKLPIETQMRRTGTGPWTLARPGAFGAMAAPSGDNAVSDAMASQIANGGAGAEALKRLLAKRAQDNN